MARLAAQARGGFYPIPPEALAHALQYLRPVSTTPIIDPCAGQGAALKQIAGHLGTPPDLIYAIELDEARAAAVADALPLGANILAPASFQGCAISNGSFGFAYVNPPFDDEIGGGRRVETAFLMRATMLLAPGGVLFFVCPHTVAQKVEVRSHFHTWYDEIAMFPFPEEHRPYDEVVVAAVRRPKPTKMDESLKFRVWKYTADIGLYYPPVVSPPTKWEKVDFTDAELSRALMNSPLRQHLRPPAELPKATPPLPLNTGHIALLLASGTLDGVVHPDGEEPHVVRGTASKVTFVSDVAESEAADGSAVTKTTYSERIVLKIRAATGDGRIRTFGE